MANGDGFSEVGGGGSVVWQVDVNDGNLPVTTIKPKSKKVRWGYAISDSDDVKDADLDGKFFLIRILNPRKGRVSVRYNRKLNTWDVYVPIEARHPKREPTRQRQIRVSWAHHDVPRDVEPLEGPGLSTAK
jgi:hypothetical protein